VNLDVTPAEAEFRDEVRTWLTAHVPREPRPLDGPEMRAFDIEWQRAQYDAGWAGIAWPAEFGGRGLSLVEQLIWHEEYAGARGPDVGVNFVGLNHGGPTLIARGTDAQKAFHLPRILQGGAIWCQGFSEPEAGSDLAALRTRAEIDGDALVVTGQKIWTSYAQHAQYQELLVRTDADAPKHKGITWVICPMDAPGIDIRPIETMDGSRDFCEVFYDEVRIPVASIVGEMHKGWGVAMSTLAFERGTAFAAHQVRLAEQIERIIAMAPADDGELSARLATARAEVAALRAMTYLAVSRSFRTELPGAEASIVRVYFAELRQRVAALALDVLGPGALELSDDRDGFTRDYLYSYAETIGGGTAEIQREIIGERVLGLPKGR
jgi:alkylation response protein AidB-like acyl-CoA dehydrogenase